MATPDDGGPAFPRQHAVVDANDLAFKLGHPGMSLRDYFAAKAMHAELVTAGALDGPAMALAQAALEAGQTIPERIAFNAYVLADAMLKARQK